MKRKRSFIEVWHPITIVLMLLIPVALYSYVYMFTDLGDVFRTQDGENFNLISNMGHSDGVSLVFVNDMQGYLITGSGMIVRTVDNGISWHDVASIPANDVVEMLHIGGNFYVMTASGDFYRGDNVNLLELVSSAGGSDFVSITGDGVYLYGLTASGDVWRSVGGDAWILVGSTGSMEMVAIDVNEDTLYAVNYSGDVFRSVDNGVRWQVVETVSQVGVADFYVTVDSLMLICFETGELMRRTGNGWQYTGTASQVGVVGISSSGVPTLIGDTTNVGMGAVCVYPLITRGLVNIESGASEVKIYGMDGRLIIRFWKSDGVKKFDVGYLRQGLYLIEVVNHRFRLIKY